MLQHTGSRNEQRNLHVLHLQGRATDTGQQQRVEACTKTQAHFSQRLQSLLQYQQRPVQPDVHIPNVQATAAVLKKTAPAALHNTHLSAWNQPRLVVCTAAAAGCCVQHGPEAPQRELRHLCCCHSAWLVVLSQEGEPVVLLPLQTDRYRRDHGQQTPFRNVGSIAEATVDNSPTAANYMPCTSALHCLQRHQGYTMLYMPHEAPRPSRLMLGISASCSRAHHAVSAPCSWAHPRPGCVVLPKRTSQPYMQRCLGQHQSPYSAVHAVSAPCPWARPRPGRVVLPGWPPKPYTQCCLGNTKAVAML
jgi:hypothetical protein